MKKTAGAQLQLRGVSFVGGEWHLMVFELKSRGLNEEPEIVTAWQFQTVECGDKLPGPSTGWCAKSVNGEVSGVQRGSDTHAALLRFCEWAAQNPQHLTTDERASKS